MGNENFMGGNRLCKYTGQGVMRCPIRLKGLAEGGKEVLKM